MYPLRSKKKNPVINDDDVDDNESVSDDNNIITTKKRKNNNSKFSLRKKKKREENNSEDLSDFIVDENEIEEEEEEFELYSKGDTKPFQNYLVKSLLKKYPSLSNKKLEKIVEKSVKKYGDIIENEYGEPVPKDEKWLAGLDEKSETTTKMKKRLSRIRSRIEEEKPSLERILRANLPMDVACDLVQRYDMIENQEPYSSERLSNTAYFNRLLRESTVKSKRHRKKIDELKEHMIKDDHWQQLVDLEHCMDSKTYLSIGKLIKSVEDLEDGREQESRIETIKLSLSLPWGKRITPNYDEQHCKKVLDSKIFGMENVKNLIYDFISRLSRNPNGQGSRLLLVGKAGSGKTAIAFAIAQALGLPFSKISFAGEHETIKIRGGKNQWVGSEPGEVLKIILRSNCENPVILLDEIDKTEHTSVQSAIMEITDSEQNHMFFDNHLPDVPINLNKVLFIATANNVSDIDPILLDRFTVVGIPDYSREEKLEIASIHFLPKIIQNIGLSKNKISVPKSTFSLIFADVEKSLDSYRSTGLREFYSLLDRILCRIARTYTLPFELKEKSDIEKLISDVKSVDNRTVISQTIQDSIYT